MSGLVFFSKWSVQKKIYLTDQLFFGVFSCATNFFLGLN